MARPKKNAVTYQSVTIRFPREILAQCHTHAAAQDRSLNEQLLHVVKQWLAYADDVSPAPRASVRLEAASGVL
jgi:hypothetical protein